MDKCVCSDEYDVYSEFDIQKHKQRYVNYLEVMIDRDGKIMYAVPSHQEKAVQMACEVKGMSRTELERACPKDYYFDYLTWLLMQSGAMAVWNEFYQCYEPTKEQYASLRRLKMNGIYRGPLPVLSKRERER